ncbi:AI-2E family transporter [Oceanisphaera profunda]|uniref:AI-2E family transporter n=1 Tax=Oceanisphaera profunda TaxID=1416627 RepID=A0A1Y0D4J0_9GAMM|nr:AI-2E family transporter [Oceanisphaera profunda]ART82127.1 AI-2E family transporter [Oceanisphaera profunda]
MRDVMERRSFLLLLLLVSLLFVLLLKPFWGAIFWACAISIIFHPMQERLRKHLGDKPNRVALLTLLICVVIVVLPIFLIATAFAQEGLALYQRVDKGEINPSEWLEQIRNAFPTIPQWFDRLGIDLGSVRESIAKGAASTGKLMAEKALGAGQITFSFIMNSALMLYLTFFLLRDGRTLIELMIKALPLGDARERKLFTKFAEVTRATVKGNLVVAIVQGALGGFIFWALSLPSPILWAVVMAFLSLIPAVGAGIVWLPVAIYLYATGDWVSATILVSFGALVIGMADNVLRPLLVGRDTKLPDYLVLFSTLGGISLMGINGFVIGPLIAALFLVVWDIFMREFNGENPHVITERSTESNHKYEKIAASSVKDEA